MDNIEHIEKILDIKFVGLEKYLDDKFEANKEEHLSLDKEAKKTNGRVKKLEIWRSALVGGWTVTMMLVGLYLKFK